MPSAIRVVDRFADLADVLAGTPLPLTGSLAWSYTAGSYVRPLLIQNSDAAKAPFSLVVGDTLLSGTQDAAMYLGYNADQGGGRLLASEPSFRLVIEQDYNSGAAHVLESYFEWVSADGIQRRRPLFWQIDRATGALNSMAFRSKGINFSDWDTDAVFMTMGSGGIVMNGDPAQTSNTILLMQAQNGKFASIQLQGGLLIDPIGANDWALRVNGGEIIRMRQHQVEIGGNQSLQAMFTVQQDATGVSNGWETVRIRAANAQTADLLDLRDKDSNILARITAAGRAKFTTALHVPVVATASLPAAGAAEDGSVLIEDNGAGDRNLILYAGAQRFRIDGGAAF